MVVCLVALVPFIPAIIVFASGTAVVAVPLVALAVYLDAEDRISDEKYRSGRDAATAFGTGYDQGLAAGIDRMAKNLPLPIITTELPNLARPFEDGLFGVYKDR
jgi:hypothetical protein